MGKRHLLFCLLIGCSSAAVDDGESGDSAIGQAQGVFEISGDASTGHLIAKTGFQRIAVVGNIGGLVVGESYYLSLAPTQEKVENMTARAVVDFRKVMHLAGTLKDASDPNAMTLTTIHGKTHTLYGNLVGSYKSIRAGLPKHDYAKTIFTLDAYEDIKQAGHFNWLGYTPSPTYRCVESDRTQTHIDLVSVQPDDSLFDGFVVTETGGEPNIGARATCGGGTCTFDAVGDDWGKASFAPAASFSLLVERTDASATKLPFACSAIDRATVASED